MITKKFFLLLLLFCVSFSGLLAQAASTDTSKQIITSDSPQWAQDLRRAEIVAFGSFPFAYFFSTFGFDSYRFFTHDRNTRYAPWPFNSAGTIEPTQDEKLMNIGIAAAGAVFIALVDHMIVLYKRYRLERESKTLPAGDPIIIRKPIYADEVEATVSEPPGTENP
jgi:hypothetical protein